MHFAKSPTRYALLITQTLHASVMFFLLMFMASGQASALEVINSKSSVNLNSGIQVLEDSTGRLRWNGNSRQLFDRV